MKQKLLNISNNIDPATLEILTLTTNIAKELDIDAFVIGATAVDIIFTRIHNITLHRATNDVDISVRVKDWSDYSKLIDKLIRHGFETTNIVHRFNYKSIPSIDVIPFGSISLPDSTIKWSGKNSKEMNVLGFEEAFNDSVIVRISENPKLDVNISSPKGLVLLKLISWKDAFLSRPRDAVDILYIIRNYIEAGNSDRLYSEHPDLVDDNFDFELTGAILLGRDIANFANETTLGYIQNLLAEELKIPGKSKFISDMLQGYFPTDNSEKNFNFCLEILKNLLEGLTYNATNR